MIVTVGYTKDQPRWWLRELWGLQWASVRGKVVYLHSKKGRAH